MSFVDPWGETEIDVWRDPFDETGGQSAPLVPTPGGAGDQVYVGLSVADDPATVDLASLDSVNGHLEPLVQLSWGPTLAGQYLIVLAPNDFGVAALYDPRFPTNMITAFTMTATVRTIEAQPYDSWTIGPLNPGLTALINVATTAP